MESTSDEYFAVAFQSQIPSTINEVYKQTNPTSTHCELFFSVIQDMSYVAARKSQPRSWKTRHLAAAANVTCASSTCQVHSFKDSIFKAICCGAITGFKRTKISASGFYSLYRVQCHSQLRHHCTTVNNSPCMLRLTALTYPKLALDYRWDSSRCSHEFCIIQKRWDFDVLVGNVYS